jgi:sulfatase maturation enzyme AslB (radical SAM superfamily)
MTTSLQPDPRIPFRIYDPLGAPTLCYLVTSQCNIYCDYCFNYAHSTGQKMAAELAVSVFDLYVRYHRAAKTPVFCPHLIFFGGEPTLNVPAILAVLEYANSNNIDCVPRVVTNGVMGDAVLERLIAERVYFQISYDGTEDVLRRTRLTMANVNGHIVPTIRKVVSSDLPVFLRATIHAGNVGSMADIVRFAVDEGVQTVAFAPLCMEGNAQRHQVGRPSIDDYERNYFKALDMALSAGIGFYSSELMYFQRGGKSEWPPLVWLPDGHLAFTIKYGSSRMSGAESVIVGRYDVEAQALEIDTAKIESMMASFVRNQAQYCSGCAAFSACRGRRLFDLYATNPELAPFDQYYCEILRRLVNRLSSYDVSQNYVF